MCIYIKELATNEQHRANNKNAAIELVRRLSSDIDDALFNLELFGPDQPKDIMKFLDEVYERRS